MTLQECWKNHSYYAPRLKGELKKITQEAQLDGNTTLLIKFFIDGRWERQTLDTADDYNMVVKSFQDFVSGAQWALSQRKGD